MAPTYSFSVRPTNVSDVQALVDTAFGCDSAFTKTTQVKFGTRCNIPILATSGQHGLDIQLAELQSGMEIDLSPFRNVSVDAEKDTLIVGGGVRFLDVFDPVFDAGKELVRPTNITAEGLCQSYLNQALDPGPVSISSLLRWVVGSAVSAALMG